MRICTIIKDKDLVAYIDSTAIKVCQYLRINRNKVFAGIQRGKSTIGQFFRFKLHLVVNDLSDILNFCVTPRNINNQTLVTKLTKWLTRKLFGD